MEKIDLGNKMAKYRKARNLNIRQLSEITELTPSMLSQIERGIANPSINTLRLIAKALDVPMFSFFIEDSNTKDLYVRANQRKRMIFPENNKLSYELLTPDLTGSIEFALMKLMPQSVSTEKLTEHNGEEVAYVMEGKLDLYLNDDVITLNNGDSVKIPANMKHKWANPYDVDSTIIFAVTPPSF